MSTLTKNRAGLEKMYAKANRTPKRWCGGCKTPNKMNRLAPRDETRSLPLTISAPGIVDYFYHEEVRGSENSGRRNPKK